MKDVKNSPIEETDKEVIGHCAGKKLKADKKGNQMGISVYREIYEEN